MLPPRMVLAIGVVMIAALAASGLPLCLAGSTSDERLAGLQFYQAGRFQQAIPLFDQVLQKHPRDLEILIKRGACYLNLDQPEPALADFDRVSRHSSWASRAFGPYVWPMSAGVFSPSSTWFPVPLPDVQFAENWGNRGIALLMLGRNEEALESFQISTSLWNRAQDRFISPRSRAGAYEGLGQAYHRLGQNELALQAYTEAIGIDATDPNGFAGRGEVLTDLRLLDDALADFAQALRLNPNQSRAYCGRGIAFSERGRDDLALPDFDHAIALDPKFGRAYSYRGALHARQGRNELALSDMSTVISLMPLNAGAFKDRGGVLVRMRKFDRAIEDLNEAIRLDPRRATAYQNRGAAWNGLGQFERAIDDLTKAIELSPENAGAHTNRGLAYFAIGEYDQSIADLSEAIKLAPRLPIPYFNRAEVYSRLDLPERALRDYDEALKIEPRFLAAHAASARLREQLGQPERAIQQYDMALTLDPKEVSLYYDRGNVRRQGGDWRGALADYDRAVLLDPRRAETYFARGWARLSAGVEGADLDARAYIHLKGWTSTLSPYMAVLAVVGARGAAQPADAKRLLDEALANLSPRTWPVPVLRYLRGDLDESGLFQVAASDRHRAEAHAFIGLAKAQAGDQAAAILHLRVARENGPAGSIAVDVASATLARLEASSK